MSQFKGKIASPMNSPPTIDYSKRVPLFLRTTTWSLHEESSSDNSVPCDSVQDGEKSVLNGNIPAVELTLGDVEIPESFSQMKDLIEAGTIRKVLSSVTPAFSMEDVIVKNVRIESSAIHVLTQPQSNVAQPVIYSHNIKRTVSVDVGDCGEIRRTWKPLTERFKSSRWKHGDHHKRGHSLSELPNATSRNYFAQHYQPQANKSGLLQRFFKHNDRMERKPFRTPSVTGLQMWVEKSDTLSLLPVEIKSVQVDYRLINEPNSIRVQTPTNTSSVTQKAAPQPEDVFSTQTELVRFSPPNGVKIGRSSKEPSRSTRATVVDCIESKQATKSEGGQTEMRSYGGDKHERPNTSLSKGTDVEGISVCRLSTPDFACMELQIKQLQKLKHKLMTHFRNKGVQTDFPLKVRRSAHSHASVSYMRPITPMHKAERFRSPSPYICNIYRCDYHSQSSERTTRSSRSLYGRRTGERSRRPRRFSLRTPATTTCMRIMLSPEIGSQRSSKRTTNRKCGRKYVN